MPRPDAFDPVAVAQHLLDVTGAAYRSGDFDAFAAAFELPMDVATFDGTRQIGSAEDLRRLFDALRSYFERIGATEILRQTVAAEEVAPDVIEATHVSHLMQGDRRLVDPFPGFSTLRRGEDGTWRVADSQYAVIARAHSKALLGPALEEAEAHDEGEGATPQPAT